MSSNNYIELKRNALKKFFRHLNPQQQEAVFNINGPQLILAGAGSGKTSVIINRIINMTIFGNAYHDEMVQGSNEDINAIKNFIDGSTDDIESLRMATAVAPVKPWNIVAITFTNKAANELKSRLTNALGDKAYMINASTFHSLCLKILRKYIHVLGYNNNFTIYDNDDSQKVIKSCLSELDISEKNFPPRNVLTTISSAKSKLMTPMDVKSAYDKDYRMNVISKIYSLYQSKLIDSNALDFDDIIMLTVQMFEKHPEILSTYHTKFKYIMVDEYQDTNLAQFRLISLLSNENNNLCVVGDDDQSIYAFRGADISNILNFENQYPNCKIVKLEQNYRSTKNILECANNLISNNENRTDKKLWTSADKGELITLYKAIDENDEAKYICDTIRSLVDGQTCKYKDCAILYRVNALSNALEKTIIKEGLPYRVYGGVKFYERKEIKDIIAYLSVINNEYDTLRLKRIINEPKRGIGDATIEVLEEISRDLKLSPLQVMLNAGEYSLLTKKATSLKNIAKMFNYLSSKAQTVKLDEFLDVLLEKTGYDEYLTKLGEEGEVRRENIMELKSNMVKYMEATENPTLNGFLEEVALYTDIDNLNSENDCISLMTVHNAKGLEFQNVFIVGLEDGIFPGYKSMEDEKELEEERRVAYVGITRAKKRLYLSSTSQRTLYGLIQRNYQSKFISEVGSELLKKVSHAKQDTSKNVTKTPTAYKSFTLQQQIASNRSKEKVSSTPQNVTFEVGDTVLHAVFGTGTVISVDNVGGDCMLKVDFAKVGTKTILTKYTKVKKITTQ